MELNFRPPSCEGGKPPRPVPLPHACAAEVTLDGVEGKGPHELGPVYAALWTPVLSCPFRRGRSMPGEAGPGRVRVTAQEATGRREWPSRSPLRLRGAWQEALRPGRQPQLTGKLAGFNNSRGKSSPMN